MSGAPNRYVIIDDGAFVQNLANVVSAGASDAGKLVALDSSGLIDPSMLGTATVSTILGFVINNGVVDAVAAFLLAPRTGTTITKCKVLTISSDPSTSL